MIGRLNTREGRAYPGTRSSQCHCHRSRSSRASSCPCTAPLALLHPAQERASLLGFVVMLGGSVKVQHIMPHPRAMFPGWVWGNSASWGMGNADLFPWKRSTREGQLLAYEDGSCICAYFGVAVCILDKKLRAARGGGVWLCSGLTLWINCE